MTTPEILALLPALVGKTELAALPDCDPRSVRAVVPFPVLADGERRVRAERLPEMEKKLAALARRAEKLGVSAPTVETVRVETLPVILTVNKVWARNGIVREYHVVRAPVTPVRLDGWTFAATIEHLRDEEGYSNIVKTSPAFGADLPAHFRHDAPTCDHCGTVRNRIETFVVADAGGKLSRVGRNCLADFIGEKNADHVVALATFEASLDDALSDDWGGEGGGYGGATAYSPRMFLAAVALVIEQVGWCSRKLARDTDRRSTADAAKDVIDPPKMYDGPRVGDITATHYVDADAALDWARAIDRDTTSDFLYNCRVVAGLHGWDYRRIGIGAAILMSYQREQERLRRIEFERRLPSTYVGEVGDRFGGAKKGSAPAMTARVLGVYTTDGQFGLTTIVRMQTPAADGQSVHDLVWFASGTVPVALLPETLAERQEALVAATAAWQAAHDRNVAARALPETQALKAERAAILARASEEGATEALALELVGVVERIDAVEDREIDTAERAFHALQVAESNLRKARLAVGETTRGVAAGDLVQITGSVKRQEVSKRTNRPETHLTRCSLVLVVE